MSLSDFVSAADSIVILTGAGISKESGLQTFRDPDGIWAKHRIEDVATPQAFARNPEVVLGFYNVRRAQMEGSNIQPNAAHAALGRLEGFWPSGVLLVTQNIDNLHARGGSRNLIHMHGELAKTRCNDCGHLFEGIGDVETDMVCLFCGVTGALRPHVVWFGEMPLDMDAIGSALGRCGLFVSIGTSGNVYPAAGFVQEARNNGAYAVELNLEESLGANIFQEGRYGPATEVVPEFVDELRIIAES
ncbi:MAG: NAD-dependent protein deacylase [Alphaproteobacteria bacterium]|nr:NAD-dependent protein deacylase [Alphaproteobacteria bacterium]HCP00579.1 NAD-dependent protein deacylase [Rhodospirillaceae bacterium]